MNKTVTLLFSLISSLALISACQPAGTGGTGTESSPTVSPTTDTTTSPTLSPTPPTVSPTGSPTISPTTSP